MSKIKIILIFIVIAILIFFLVIGINSISRLRVLNMILDKANLNIDKDNYSLKTSCKIGDSVTETNAYYRNGVGRFVASNGIYTWTDGKDAYMIDDENKIIYVLKIENSPEILVSSDMFAYLIPGYNEGLFGKIKITGNMFNKFSTEKINDEDCYKIITNEDKFIKTTWISKKSLNPVKAKIQFQAGDPIEYEYDLKFVATKISSITLPNLEEYKVIDYETKEVIAEKLYIDQPEIVD